MKKILFLIAFMFVFSTVFAAPTPPPERPSAEDCGYITSVGFASKETSSVLDADKITIFMASGEQAYLCFKNMMGLWDYDFYITITDISGTEFKVIDGSNIDIIGVYGVFPGKTTEQLVSSVSVSIQGQISPIQKFSAPLGGISAYAVLDPNEPLASPDTFKQYTTPDFSKFENVKTFKRVVLINNGAYGYETALITLGVWH